jgi:anti-anti-sigma factor
MHELGCPTDSASYVIRTTHAGPVLHLGGELDSANEASLVQAIHSLGRLVDDRVLIDLTEVTMLGSSAVHGLITAAEALRANAQDIEVVAASPLAARVIEICGLGDYFHLAPTAASV